MAAWKDGKATAPCKVPLSVFSILHSSLFDLWINTMATTDSAKAIALLVLCVQASASTAGASDVTAIVESRYTKLGCTSVVIGPKATVDGSVIATHNADCLNCDFRIARTPAMTHDAGNLKSVLKYKVILH